VNGKVKVKFDLAIELSICTRPPTKKDFIKALVHISSAIVPEYEIDTCIRDEGPTPRWIQMIADEIAKKCKHPNCSKKPVGKYQLVEKCHLACEPVYLFTKMPQSIYFNSDKYETADCCKLYAENMMEGDISVYGFAVARDIINYEGSLAEQYELKAQLMVAETEWRQAFIEEMRLLIGIERMPEKLRDKFLEAYEDAAEYRHLDR
jgi:hypothetical protein